jgi:hypothetical protein
MASKQVIPGKAGHRGLITKALSHETGHGWPPEQLSAEISVQARLKKALNRCDRPLKQLRVVLDPGTIPWRHWPISSPIVGASQLRDALIFCQAPTERVTSTSSRVSLDIVAAKRRQEMGRVTVQ